MGTHINTKTAGKVISITDFEESFKYRLEDDITLSTLKWLLEAGKLSNIDIEDPTEVSGFNIFLITCLSSLEGFLHYAKDNQIDLISLVQLNTPVETN